MKMQKIHTTEDHLIKISKIRKGKKNSKEHKANSSRGLIGRTITNRKKRSVDFQKKQIKQIDAQSNNLIKMWDSIKDASIQLNIKSSGIVSCAKGKLKTSGGFVWQYVDPKNIKEGASPKNPRSESSRLALAKKVDQYCLDGKLIKTWSCLSDAARYSKVSNAAIASVAQFNRKRKTAAGFVWRYTGDPLGDISKIKIDLNPSKSIDQFSKEMELIKQWKSIHKAAKDVGVHRSNIAQVLKGNKKSSGGFIWKYAENKPVV